MDGSAHDDEGMPAPVVVPDDASALEPDRRAWLAEQRAGQQAGQRARAGQQAGQPATRRRTNGRWRRLLFTRRWERFGLSGPLVVLCLLVTAVFGGLTVVFVPRPRLPEPGPAPLANVPEIRMTAPAASAVPDVEVAGGDVIDRRLPLVDLDADVRSVSTADLRPAVVVLVPRDCGCVGVLKEIYRQAREFRLTVWLVGGRTAGESGVAPARRRLVLLDETGTAGGARWAVDREGTLSTALVARGTTLIAVRADGTVAALWRDIPLDGAHLPALEPLIARLGASNH